MSIEIEEKIEAVLEKLRPSLALHGGDVKLVGFNLETGEVDLELKGACVGCPMSNVTLKYGIEESLKEEIPEVKGVNAV